MITFDEVSGRDWPLGATLPPEQLEQASRVEWPAGTLVSLELSWLACALGFTLNASSPNHRIVRIEILDGFVGSARKGDVVQATRRSLRPRELGLLEDSEARP